MIGNCPFTSEQRPRVYVKKTLPFSSNNTFDTKLKLLEVLSMNCEFLFGLTVEKLEEREHDDDLEDDDEGSSGTHPGSTQRRLSVQKPQILKTPFAINVH